MATPATSVNWVISFQRQSTIDQTRYSITYAADTVTKSQMIDLTKELSRIGFVSVDFGLVVVLP
jgi:hypothetical protein